MPELPEWIAPAQAEAHCYLGKDFYSMENPDKMTDYKPYFVYWKRDDFVANHFSHEILKGFAKGEKITGSLDKISVLRSLIFNKNGFNRYKVRLSSAFKLLQDLLCNFLNSVYRATFLFPEGFDEEDYKAIDKKPKNDLPYLRDIFKEFYCSGNEARTKAFEFFTEGFKGEFSDYLVVDFIFSNSIEAICPVDLKSASDEIIKNA